MIDGCVICNQRVEALHGRNLTVCVPLRTTQHDDCYTSFWTSISRTSCERWQLTHVTQSLSEMNTSNQTQQTTHQEDANNSTTSAVQRFSKIILMRFCSCLEKTPRPKNGNIHQVRHFRLPMITLSYIKASTIISDIPKILTAVGRKKAPLDTFFARELSTETTFIHNKSLNIDDMFSEKMMYTALRNYVSRYVLCYSCLKEETVLYKNCSVLFMRCIRCGKSGTIRYNTQKTA